jgi:CRP/FNR family transcriptional regulator, cyclic AMP receptor protein
VSGVSEQRCELPVSDPWSWRSASDRSFPTFGNRFVPSNLSRPPSLVQLQNPAVGASPITQAPAGQFDPFYLFACYIEWEQTEEPNAGWELLAATQSADNDTHAYALSLLGTSRHLSGPGTSAEFTHPKKRQPALEEEMKAPYGLEIVESCADCPLTNESFFCGLSRPLREAFDQVSHKSVLPAGAILFVEGQVPRGIFIVCAGKVSLSTTSREGKTLILKTAAAGEVLGLSATVSGTGYEATAETSVPCQLNFVDRKNFLELMQSHSEIGVQAAQYLSKDFRSAHRDIHDLVLTRSSAGKLARLLLSQSPAPEEDENETHVHSPMTHEEMAQRIGASRETVTRLLTNLRKKQLIRLEGPILTIRNRPGLEALAR